MKNTQEKIKKLSPILKIREGKFEEESKLLSALESQRNEISKIVEDSKEKYRNGVKSLNELRTKEDLNVLSVFEKSVDHVRDVWVTRYKSLQALDKKILMQREMTNFAKKELKAIEHLIQKYTEVLKSKIDKEEQKTLDEFSIMKHRKV